MNWQQITAIATLLMTIIGATWSSSQALVFAEPYKAYQHSQKLRWAEYDADRLWRQYGDVQRYKDGKLKKDRLLDLQRQMKINQEKIKSLRGG